MNMSKNAYGRTYDIKIIMRKERPLCGFLVDRDPYTDIVFALGVRADKEVIDLIDYASNGASIVNIFFAQIYDADEKCEHFRREDKALDFVDKMHKARFLGYMLRCLLEAYTGHRKCDNRDSFRNKRDLYGDRDVHPIEHYLDASIVTNGLTRTFSTGAWCHPFKWMERVYKVVGNLGRANPLQTMIDLRKNKAASSVHEKGSYALLWLLRTWMKLEHLRGRNYIFASLLDKGIIEFIGTEEEKDCCTAWGIRFLLEDIAGKQSMKYTHCELDMSFLLGKCAESVTDHRVKLKYTERGMVQKVVLSSKDEGKNFAVVSW
ncbi:hypothetical protein SADUNF_Sadunf07G0064900 [Salix dunnii]|uniref:DNA-directed RNA polymerase n=1 Tax=Salix dunnii TaxID=1413687 RepID=A0A835JWH0_9ROSI|nr:hypothetical protein SADUNF_Sadunf07G0064900 [Salix dunnii]